MTIKTEQLRHSLHELEVHLDTLEKLSSDKPLLSANQLVDIFFAVHDSTRDCIGIIASILEDHAT